jgi:hypothetical protein
VSAAMPPAGRCWSSGVEPKDWCLPVRVVRDEGLEMAVQAIGGARHRRLLVPLRVAISRRGPPLAGAGNTETPRAAPSYAPAPPLLQPGEVSILTGIGRTVVQAIGGWIQV